MRYIYYSLYLVQALVGRISPAGREIQFCCQLDLALLHPSDKENQQHMILRAQPNLLIHRNGLLGTLSTDLQTKTLAAMFSVVTVKQASCHMQFFHICLKCWHVFKRAEGVLMLSDFFVQCNSWKIRIFTCRDKTLAGAVGSFRAWNRPIV